MQAYRFGNLPKDLSIGPAFLAPGIELAKLIQICSVCQKLNHNYSVCMNGHILCPSCTPPLFNDKTWCCSCQNRTKVKEISVPREHLERLEFYCACGFDGTLREIQEHLKRSDLPGRRCFGITADEKASERPFFFPAGRSIGKKTERFEGLTDLLEKMNVETESWLKRFEKPLEVGRNEIRLNLFDLLYNRTGDIFKNVDSYQLYLRFECRNREFLELQIAAKNDPHMPVWPAKVQIVVTLYNIYGIAKSKLVVPSFEDGEYTSKSFFHGIVCNDSRLNRLDAEWFTRPFRFVALRRLLQTDMIMGRDVIIGLSVLPL